MPYSLDFEQLRRARLSPPPVKVAPVAAPPRSELSRMYDAEPLNDARFSVRDRQQLAARLAQGGNQLFQSLIFPEEGPVADFDIDGERGGRVAPALLNASATPGVPGAGSGLSAAVEAVLMGSAQGQFALDTLRKYGVTLALDPGTAPQYLPGTNVCKLNTKMSPEVSASYFIHEMYHAYMHHTKQSLDASGMVDTPDQRERFVEQHVTEEIVGTLKGIEGVLTYEPSGAIRDEPGKRGVACYSEYLGAYNFNLKQQLSAGASLPAAQQVAQKLARAAVRIYFDDPQGMRIRYKPFGGVLTYREHYGREWDRIQQAQRGKRVTP